MRLWEPFTLLCLSHYNRTFQVVHQDLFCDSQIPCLSTPVFFLISGIEHQLFILKTVLYPKYMHMTLELRDGSTISQRCIYWYTTLRPFCSRQQCLQTAALRCTRLIIPDAAHRWQGPTIPCCSQQFLCLIFTQSLVVNHFPTEIWVQNFLGCSPGKWLTVA